MSKTFDIDDELSLTFFYGGEEKGQMIQLTGYNDDLVRSYIHITIPQMQKPIKDYKKLTLKKRDSDGRRITDILR